MVIVLGLGLGLGWAWASLHSGKRSAQVRSEEQAAVNNSQIAPRSYLRFLTLRNDDCA